jgi:hypothetical protein
LQDSEHAIKEEQIKSVSSILKNFAKLNMDEDEINKFLDDILTYFVLLNRYVKQFDQIGAREHFTVRMALEVFLVFVKIMI